MASESVTPAQAPSLRRELRFWETIALSIGIMAPTAAMALNGVGVAANVGRAVPLAMIIATIGVFLVSFAFVRLARHYAHAGSVYAFSGATLGPRAGFFSGWALLGTYLAFTVASTCEIGLFFPAFLNGAGIWSGTEWIWVALIAAGIIWALAYGDVKVVTRVLLSIEGMSITLILILMVVIFLKLAGVGTHPPGAGYSSDVFSLPSGVSRSALGLGIVLAFLSFGGFEGAAALGEETENPRREVPRAIRNAVIAAGIFYTLCFLAQSWGFGTNAKGVAQFASSSSPLGDLATSYIGTWMANLINLGAAVSAFASALGAAVGASRILFAMGRDGLGPRQLGESSPRTGAPAWALAVVMVIALIWIIGQRIHDVNVVNTFFYPGTIGVLSMIVAYVVTNVGAIKLFEIDRAERGWTMIVPPLAIVFLVYVFWRNASGVPWPYDRFPFLVAAWAAVGLLIVLAVPGLAGRIGTTMSRLGSESTAGD
ncbi:MAG TPA: APC family permease [Gaiellales bacterium]|nr:APC family permease [Gaiellales bacterium]